MDVFQLRALIAVIEEGSFSAAARKLHRRRLVKLRVEAWGEDEHKLYLSAVYRGDVTFGPAHRWLLAHLERLCLRDAGRRRRRSRRPAVRTPGSRSGTAGTSGWGSSG